MPRTPLLLFASALLLSSACRSNPSGSDSGAPAANAVDACIEVMRTEAASTDPARAGKMSRGCAAVYKEPTCRDAHLKTDEVEPPKRSVTLTRACALAYCPKLPEPRPKLCDPNLDKPGDLAELWWELRLEIWKLDLGPAEAKRLEKEMLHVAAQAQQGQSK